MPDVRCVQRKGTEEAVGGRGGVAGERGLVVVWWLGEAGWWGGVVWEGREGVSVGSSERKGWGGW